MIRNITCLLVLLIFAGTVLSQGLDHFVPGTGELSSNTEIITGDTQLRFRSPQLSHYRNFYRNNLGGRLQFGQDYSGISGSLIRLRSNRLAMGFTFQLNQIFTGSQTSQELNPDLQSSGQYLFVPFLFTMKYHLVNDVGVADVVPYIIAGAGPTLGLHFPYGNNFFSTLQTISGQLGGGGFAGIGVDYLWSEEWALSLDVRYNLFRFSQPFGPNQEYRGVSFFMGFSRALDY
jgi:hypothetical protein